MVSVSPQFNVPMQLAGVNRHHVPGNRIVEIAGFDSRERSDATGRPVLEEMITEGQAILIWKR
jgi:hypothetical protein